MIFVLALPLLLGVILHSALGGIANKDDYEYDYQDDYIDYDSVDETQGQVEDSEDAIDEQEKPLEIEKNIIDAEDDVEYEYDDDLDMELDV